MTLIAVATMYDERFTWSREITPHEELTDEEIIEFMAQAGGIGDVPIDSCVLITVDGDETFTQELIDQ